MRGLERTESLCCLPSSNDTVTSGLEFLQPLGGDISISHRGSGDHEEHA